MIIGQSHLMFGKRNDNLFKAIIDAEFNAPEVLGWGVLGALNI